MVCMVKWLFQGMVDESKLRATSGLISNLVNRLVVMCDEENAICGL